jgi:hypothetical protein
MNPIRAMLAALLLSGCPGPSSYLKMTNSLTVNASTVNSNNERVLLSTTVDFKGANCTPKGVVVCGSLFVHSDGGYSPNDPNTMASVYIKVDGKQFSNDSIIDWRGSSVASQHSFNVIGANTTAL